MVASTPAAHFVFRLPLVPHAAPLVPNPGGGLAAAAAAGPAAKKRRKAVDRRASKGRKIRYNVHDKLVGFMAPVVSEPPAFAVQLFTNLFGHSGQ